jgi:hypothetical protein
MTDFFFVVFVASVPHPLRNRRLELLLHCRKVQNKYEQTPSYSFNFKLNHFFFFFFSGEGAALLVAEFLRMNSSLKQLDLRGQSESLPTQAHSHCFGFSFFAFVSGTKVNSEGIKHISECLKGNTSLQRLRLGGSANSFFSFFFSLSLDSC